MFRAVPSTEILGVILANAQIMGKITDLDSLASEIDKLKKGKKRIVLAGGSFDIIHPGHIDFIEKSHALADILILLLESDEKIKKLKGKDRPVNNQKDRASVLSKIDKVDLVVLLPELKNDEDYENIVNLIQPDIIAVTKEDPIKAKKLKQARSVGGKIKEVMSTKKGYSTSKIIKKINNI